MAKAKATPKAVSRDRPGWFVRICVRNTVTTSIQFEVGKGGDDSTHRPWFTWHKAGSPLVAEYDFPTDLINTSEIWMKACADPQEDAQCCICYQDHVVKKMSFHKCEEHEKHQDDTDNCDC